MSTIKDVAMRAGVSVGTASKVMSNHASVKASLRQRVETAVRELAYKPNLAARALRTNKIDIIGLVVPDITNPFFAQLAKDVEMAAARWGISVMLANSLGNAEMEELRIGAILDRAPRGIIIVASSDSAHIKTRANVPMIALDRPFGDFPHVSTDHEKSAALAADHLYELGHRRICYIAGPRDTNVARDREKGFTARIKYLSTAKDPVELTVQEGAFDYASGETIARRLLSMDIDKRPTAIAAASDQQAIGVVRAARDMGVRIPDDLSVIGYDDINLASLIVPRLSTIRQPINELAMTAVKLILSIDTDDGSEEFVGSLIHRSSTDRPSIRS